MGPGTVCDRCRKKMKRVEKRGAAERERAALQAQQAVQGRTGLTKADTLLIGPGGGEARLTVHGSFSKSAAASRGGSRAGSIVNGASRRSSPIGGKGNMTPARMVQPPPSSSLSTRKPMTSGSSGSQRSGSGGSPRSARSMDMDADGEPDDDFDGHDSQHEEGDGEIDELEDMTKAEEEVDGELADLVGDTESKVVSQRHVEKDCKKPGGSGVISNRSQFNIDIAVSQLAGMDDDTTADSPRARKIKRSRSGSAEDAGAGVEVEEDAEADLLEAVDAAEANSDD
ncbi:hypothetical protein K435DRAFT_296497 [Dendrothele bispora CBS 962.96]|uniref:Uncharacterized protein n=1 Tax=Dendrothele bispora (strain CBS 962.96) TaxID=1314807 RepID=A0A4V4HDZ5_DENBC|nr:hypothetical protein K435DRAFT_296497 [Dendrothele bispora CBS 962.96]